MHLVVWLTVEHDRVMSRTCVTRAPSAQDVPLEAVSPDDGPAQLRKAFGCAPSSVAVIAGAADAAQVSGMLVSSLMPVSLDPPLLSICVQAGSQTWARLSDCDHLGVSVLDDTCESLCDQLVRPSAERFVGVDHRATDRGAVLLPDAGAWFECSIHDEVSAGDHTIVLLRIEQLGASPEARPLVFHGSRYRRLVA
jgi:flavin reductase (DIM6/NTAB) family NADH-FMN oxidoreductase RutF